MNPMITPKFGQQFAKEWIEAWNSHDIDRILSHYSEDITMSSPYIAQVTGTESGTLTGKAAIRNYWTAALQKAPHLSFKLVQTLLGADTVTIYYRGVRGFAAEVFFFGQDLLVVRAAAHYE